MSTYRGKINELFGEETIRFLYVCIKDGRIGKTELEELASVLEEIPIYRGYKDRDPFDAAVGKRLFSALLDKESVNAF